MASIVFISYDKDSLGNRKVDISSEAWPKFCEVLEKGGEQAGLKIILELNGTQSQTTTNSI